MAARPGLALVRASVLVLFGLAATLAGCGSGDEPAGSAPAKPPEQTAEQAPAEETTQVVPEEETRAAGEAARTATVRLSGTEGTVYAGNYGNLDSSEYAEGVLEGEPVEFEVDMRDSGFDVVTASFTKPATSDTGLLAVEILSDGEVVAEQDVETQYGALSLTWSSEG